jgi:hypothetical protein
MFKKGSGNWTEYRKLQPSVEVDLHYSEFGPREIHYWEAMGRLRNDALEALKDAHQRGIRFVIFRHGSSTSRPGKTTARSEVRNLMRSKDATPYIVRSECIQHESVFVAAIRQNPDAALTPGT